MLFLLFFLFSLASAYEWGLVIDAGSSGSRIRIYSWNERSSYTVDPNITQFIPANSTDANLLQITPGLSAYVDNPEDAGPSLEQLIVQSQRWVPQELWSQTPLILRATAGMRLLYESDQNAIFASVRSYLRTSPYLFTDDSATIASGEQEAVWAWVCANYLSGYLSNPQPDPSVYVSTVELGGASTQIEFIPDVQLLASRYDIEVFGQRLTFYAHSFLKFGTDQFLIRLRTYAISQAENTTLPIPMPCFYEGYNDTWNDTNGIEYEFYGTSEYDLCYNYSEALMSLTIECLQEPCSYFGTYQPSLPPSNQTYWGISAYFYAVYGVGLVSFNGVWNGTVSDIEPHAITQCSKNWTQAQQDLPNETPANVAVYCFYPILVINMLRAYGAENYPIIYANKMYGQTIGWPLGAIIDQLNLLPIVVTPTTESCSGSKNDEIYIGVFSGLGGLIFGFVITSYMIYQKQRNEDPMNEQLMRRVDNL